LALHSLLRFRCCPPLAAAAQILPSARRGRTTSQNAPNCRQLSRKGADMSWWLVLVARLAQGTVEEVKQDEVFESVESTQVEGDMVLHGSFIRMMVGMVDDATKLQANKWRVRMEGSASVRSAGSEATEDGKREKDSGEGEKWSGEGALIGVLDEAAVKQLLVYTPEVAVQMIYGVAYKVVREAEDEIQAMISSTLENKAEGPHAVSTQNTDAMDGRRRQELEVEHAMLDCRSSDNAVPKSSKAQKMRKETSFQSAVVRLTTMLAFSSKHGKASKDERRCIGELLFSCQEASRFWYGFTIEDTMAMADYVSFESYQAGSVIVAEGEPLDYAIILVRGEVEEKHSTYSKPFQGARQPEDIVWYQGAVLNARKLFTDKRISDTTLQVAVNGTLVGKIQVERLEEMCRQPGIGDVAMRLMKLLVHRALIYLKEYRMNLLPVEESFVPIHPTPKDKLFKALLKSHETYMERQMHSLTERGTHNRLLLGSFWPDITKEEIHFLLDFLFVTKVTNNQVLIRQNYAGSLLGFIFSGSLKKMYSPGDMAQIAAFRTAGEMVGEVCFTDMHVDVPERGNEVRSATNSRVAMFNTNQLFRLCRANPKLAFKLQRHITGSVCYRMLLELKELGDTEILMKHRLVLPGYVVVSEPLETLLKTKRPLRNIRTISTINFRDDVHKISAEDIAALTTEDSNLSDGSLDTMLDSILKLVPDTADAPPKEPKDLETSKATVDPQPAGAEQASSLEGSDHLAGSAAVATRPSEQPDDQGGRQVSPGRQGGRQVSPGRQGGRQVSPGRQQGQSHEESKSTRMSTVNVSDFPVSRLKQQQADMQGQQQRQRHAQQTPPEYPQEQAEHHERPGLQGIPDDDRLPLETIMDEQDDGEDHPGGIDALLRAKTRGQSEAEERARAHRDTEVSPAPSCNPAKRGPTPQMHRGPSQTSGGSHEAQAPQLHGAPASLPTAAGGPPNPQPLPRRVSEAAPAMHPQPQQAPAGEAAGAVGAGKQDHSGVGPWQSSDAEAVAQTDAQQLRDTRDAQRPRPAPKEALGGIQGGSGEAQLNQARRETGSRRTSTSGLPPGTPASSLPTSAPDAASRQELVEAEALQPSTSLPPGSMPASTLPTSAAAPESAVRPEGMEVEHDDADALTPTPSRRPLQSSTTPRKWVWREDGTPDRPEAEPDREKYARTHEHSFFDDSRPKLDDLAPEYRRPRVGSVRSQRSSLSTVQTLLRPRGFETPSLSAPPGLLRKSIAAPLDLYKDLHDKPLSNRERLKPLSPSFPAQYKRSPHSNEQRSSRKPSTFRERKTKSPDEPASTRNRDSKQVRIEDNVGCPEPSDEEEVQRRSTSESSRMQMSVDAYNLSLRNRRSQGQRRGENQWCPTKWFPVYPEQQYKPKRPVPDNGHSPSPTRQRPGRDQARTSRSETRSVDSGLIGRPLSPPSEPISRPATSHHLLRQATELAAQSRPVTSPDFMLSFGMEDSRRAATPTFDSHGMVPNVTVRALSLDRSRPSSRSETPSKHDFVWISQDGDITNSNRPWTPVDGSLAWFSLPRCNTPESVLVAQGRLPPQNFQNEK
ncbi:hypothetical protein CYMTET_32658, partial [Cymbomonas tetramitiformis]